MMDLLARRAQVAARAKILESVQGSGWHKSDPQEAERRSQGGVPLSQKLIGLKDDDRVYLVGPCAAVALQGLQEFIDSVAKAKDEARANDVDLDFTPIERHALRSAKRIVEIGGDKLSFPTQDWNGALFALSQSGIQCVLADANHVPEEER